MMVRSYFKSRTVEPLAAAITKDVSEKEAAASGLAACIRYLDLVNDPNNFNQYSFNVFDLTQFMKLDKTAYAALNLFSTDGVHGGLVAGTRKYADSLYSVLDNCKTVEVSFVCNSSEIHAIVEARKILIF